MPNAEIVALAQQYAAEYGGSVSVMHDPLEAIAGADVVYLQKIIIFCNDFYLLSISQTVRKLLHHRCHNWWK